MFGMSKEEKKLVGAAEKMAVVQRMKATSKLDMLQKGGSIQDYQYVIPLTLIFAIAVILALLSLDMGNNALSNMHLTGIASIDRILTGTSVVSFTGSEDMNRVIFMFLRGAGYFLMAGIIPLVAMFLSLFTNKERVNPLTLCWAAGIIVPFVYLLWSEGIYPLLKEFLFFLI